MAVKNIIKSVASRLKGKGKKSKRGGKGNG